MNQRDKECRFAKAQSCTATLYSFCPSNCKFRCTPEGYRQNRQRSFDRRMRLGYLETAADINDLRAGFIKRQKNTKEEQSNDLQEH